MATHKVTFEIEVDASSPIQAAKEVQDWLQNPNDNWQFYVQNDETKRIVSVDLDEDETCMVNEAIDYTPIIEVKK